MTGKEKAEKSKEGRATEQPRTAAQDRHCRTVTEGADVKTVQDTSTFVIFMDFYLLGITEFQMSCFVL